MAMRIKSLVNQLRTDCQNDETAIDNLRAGVAKYRKNKGN